MTNKYKIGDCVQHNNSQRIARVLSVTSGTVTVELDDDTRLIWSNENLRLVAEEEMNQPKKESNQYTFSSVCVLDIDFTLIQSELTKAHPMALVTVGDDTFVVIHKSLRIKATICQIECPNPVHDITKVAMKVSESYSEWIQWAKIVKGATWPDAARNKTTVTVALPTI